MSKITVSLKGRDGTRSTYTVRVSDGSASAHEVDLDQSYYQELTNGKETPEKLIERSFVFLLTHESQDSILPKFNLEQISYYFPEYEDTIKTS
ncbi:hypothetical protein A3E39_02070 [Candidatus Uhrbacteria bacterium RIFCSPHIGHO2_12_FULL_60_25]|uniref:Uncharacterized protein n=1 Tax=Candidatus Uhrbacteria bacterium RIFCSPHIGHO2_12_FULL_60_25 TaxID=1802399 RepID=A0A1F7UJZ8_9BACT|nr:MAG: hypothetical protein A3D73_00620 [Candidatus Uhrbacteria bacterium RIFCSPHIGHO2_02_FULL_60_44]OGL78575.1 MAG: hypothetical protein A3E39_02070 [Candidatus Uhrbacteria bacterium RIFCSPHIGHO2_12_FULL_60_25]